MGPLYHCPDETSWKIGRKAAELFPRRERMVATMARLREEWGLKAVAEVPFMMSCSNT